MTIGYDNMEFTSDVHTSHSCGAVGVRTDCVRTGREMPRVSTDIFTDIQFQSFALMGSEIMKIFFPF